MIPGTTTLVSDSYGPSDFLLGLPLTARLHDGSPTSVFLPRLLARAPSYKEPLLSLVIDSFQPTLHLLAPFIGFRSPIFRPRTRLPCTTAGTLTNHQPTPHTKPLAPSYPCRSTANIFLLQIGCSKTHCRSETTPNFQLADAGTPYRYCRGTRTLPPPTTPLLITFCCRRRIIHIILPLSQLV